MNYQIVHAIEGRIRIRIAQLAEESFRNQLKSQIEQLKAVTDVRINLQAASVVVTYRTRMISSAAIQEALHQMIEQLIPPEPSPVNVPPVASAVAPPSTNSDALDLTPTPPVDLEADVWADQPAEASQLADPEVHLKVETPAPEQLKPKAEHGAYDLPVEVGYTACSTAGLAQRLGVSIQTINLRRSKPEFETWSQTRDPDGIAWKYQGELKVFVPVQTGL